MARDTETPRDPEPWESRKPPSERPRHESAQPEEPEDPAQTSAAIAAESWGEVIEVRDGETVDGDFNGAPELAALAETQNWEGVDTLEGMEGVEAEALPESRAPDELLADAIADRRQVLLDRLDEARELGLGPEVEAVLSATETDAAGTPLVRDEDVLRDQLAEIDGAIERLEQRSTEAGTEG
jgi:hypothetical protein